MKARAKSKTKSTTVTSKIKWQYWGGAIIGLVVILGLAAWCFYMSVQNGVFVLKSFYPWVGMLLMFFSLQPIISLGAMRKQVAVNAQEVVITYVFKKEPQRIAFSEIKTVDVKQAPKKSASAGLRDSFTIVLAGNRRFTFERSELQRYEQVKKLVMQPRRKF